MSNSSTLLDTIATNQSNKEVVANALFDAASPAMLFGRHASACSGLTWGYYGGQFGTNAIANGTVTLTASSTNYVQANSSGVVSANTSGFTSGYTQLYTIVTGTTTVTSYTDLRQSGSGSGGGSGTVTSIAGAGGIESATGAITGSGTLRETMLLAGGAVQTAAYAFVTGDRGATLIMNSASAVSQVLPTPTGTTLTTNFPTGWFGWIENIGAGTTTLGVPSGEALDGVTNGTIALAQNTGVGFFTDGTHWFTLRGAASGGGGGSTTFAGLTDVSVSSPVAGQVPVYNSTTSKWTNTTPTQCAFSAGNSTSQSIAASTVTTLTGWTATQDGSGGAMNFSTGVFTAPVTGWYAASGSYQFSSAAWTAGQFLETALMVNGSQGPTCQHRTEGAITTFMASPDVCAVVYLTSGQTLSLAAQHGNSSAQTLSGTSYRNSFSVALIAPVVSPAGSVVDMLSYYPTVPTASAVLMSATTLQPWVLPASLTGSYAHCDTAPTGAVSCTIERYTSGAWTSIGSVNFAASANTGTFTFTSSVTTIAGDRLRVLAPSSVDATFAGIDIGILASR